MDIITLDFETYYDKEYSLSRMSTEDYVNDERFEIIMVGVKVNDGKTTWHSYSTMDEYAALFGRLGLANSACLAHNMQFDGLILSRHFPERFPARLLDTLGLAQAVLKPYHRSISLDSCLKHTKAPITKLGTVYNMVGRRLKSLSTSELAEYGKYCATDVEGTYWLFKRLAPEVPRSELDIIDLTLRMYLQPQFVLDHNILSGVLRDARQHKQDLMDSLPDGITRTQLSSNVQFAKLLEDHGVDVPMKISPTTNLPTYAFSKNDTGWKELEDDYADDPVIGPMLAARLGVKSTLAESRAERLLAISERYGWFRVPLRYYAAHTGRYGGMERINAQNFTRINPKNQSRYQLRYGVCAPVGFTVLACDLSQIEARLNAWLANASKLLGVFRANGDPYCVFASELYNRPIVKSVDDHERFIGKTCILGLGYGMGWNKLRATLRARGVIEDEQAVQRYVSVYRQTYPEIPALWRFCDETIQIMAGGGKRVIGPCMAHGHGVELPNGMKLHYPNLRYVEEKKYKGWAYDFAGQGRTMWGGKFVENLIQSLARITIMEHMLRAHKELGLKPALQAHDELVYVVPNARLAECEAGLLSIMKTPPSFAPDLPIDAESGTGPTYGDAK